MRIIIMKTRLASKFDYTEISVLHLVDLFSFNWNTVIKMFLIQLNLLHPLLHSIWLKNCCLTHSTQAWFFLYFRPKIYSHGFTPFFFAWKGLLVVNLSIEVEYEEGCECRTMMMMTPLLLPYILVRLHSHSLFDNASLTWKEMRWKFTEKRDRKKGDWKSPKKKCVFHSIHDQRRHHCCCHGEK